MERCSNDTCPEKKQCIRYADKHEFVPAVYFEHDPVKKRCEDFIERAAPLTDKEDLN